MDVQTENNRNKVAKAKEVMTSFDVQSAVFRPRCMGAHQQACGAGLNPMGLERSDIPRTRQRSSMNQHGMNKTKSNKPNESQRNDNLDTKQNFYTFPTHANGSSI